MSDRLSRADRRTLQRLDQQILGQPLYMGSDPRPAAAHVRHMVHLLRSPQSESPCSDALVHITALFDRTVPDQATKMIACRKGCAHCCTQPVVVTAPEAFWVAAQVRKRPKVAAAIKQAAASIGHLPLQERLKAQTFCPMLDEALCSIYAGRPIGCRGFVSVDLDACLRMFTRAEITDIPMPNDTVQILYAVRMLLASALRLLKLPETVYEMNTILALILATENAEARWLAGEDIFASLESGPPAPPQYDIAIGQMAQHVAPTI
jgi:hypothetical protein